MHTALAARPHRSELEHTTTSARVPTVERYLLEQIMPILTLWENALLSGIAGNNDVDRFAQEMTLRGTKIIAFTKAGIIAVIQALPVETRKALLTAPIRTTLRGLFAQSRVTINMEGTIEIDEGSVSEIAQMIISITQEPANDAPTPFASNDTTNW